MTQTLRQTASRWQAFSARSMALVSVSVRFALSVIILAVVLLAVNLFERRDKETKAKAASVGVRG